MEPLAILLAAQAAHEANRFWCLSHGDTSQAHWEDTPLWQQESILAGVRAIYANPQLTPAESHAKWFAYKQAEGWVYGAEKNVEAKTHPCMVAYDELPEHHKVKDSLFGGVVRGVLFASGLD